MDRNYGMPGFGFGWNASQQASASSSGQNDFDPEALCSDILRNVGSLLEESKKAGTMPTPKVYINKGRSITAQNVITDCSNVTIHQSGGAFVAPESPPVYEEEVIPPPTKPEPNPVPGRSITAQNVITDCSNVIIHQSEGTFVAPESPPVYEEEVIPPPAKPGPNPVPGSIRLSDSIYMFHEKPYSENGNVYKGVQSHGISGNKDIAIKFMEYNEETLRESQIHVKVNRHHNVPIIYQCEHYLLGPIKHIYIAMELCGNDNLAEFIKKTEITKRLREKLIENLVEVILHVHGKNVVHCDLKPENILISLGGSQVKLIDFSSSREVMNGESVTSSENMCVGTNGWRAPEMYNTNVRTKQADIFSLALLIYFVQTDGSHPFGDDPDRRNLNIKHYQECDLSKLKSEPKLKDLVRWMLRLDPHERPSITEIDDHEYFRRKNLVCPYPELGLNQSALTKNDTTA
uniref:serine/threonine-protein kinase/endoribonuclease IRE1-like isoform X1 n=1 Tax=Styela clava TaxID=7725 RepID=UPI001939B18C|nr:serine/threonine-protein kinase/endoribonuclease IRE1-like isoform X1 [Styela clava]